MSILPKSKHVLTFIVSSCVLISSPLSKDQGIIDLTPLRNNPIRTSEASAVVGHIFHIKLQYNAGTPFNWQCASANETIADVKDLGTRREFPSNDGMVGFRQNRSFMISAISPGNTTIKCDLVSFNGQADSTTYLLLSIK